MTDQPTCTAGCGRPSPDAMLCNRCAAQLERILAELPAHLAELEVTLTRQARTTRSGGGKPTKAAESPLPYDVAASDLQHRVRNGLSTWIRHVAENGSVPRHHGPVHLIGGCQHDSCWEIRTGVPTIERTEDMAVWLVGRVKEIRQDEAADELLSDLQAIRSELRAAVDNRQYRYAGPCTAVLELGAIGAHADGERIVLLATGQIQCGADLKHRVGAPTIVCRECAAEYDATERSEWIDKRAGDEVASASRLAQVLTDSGYLVKAATIRKWGERGRLAASVARLVAGYGPACTACSHPSCERIRRGREYQDHLLLPCAVAVLSRAPEYRVGAVYDRVKADPARRLDADRIGA